MIRIEHFQCGYSDKFRLSDIDLHISTGEFLSVIGPNGSGKTTLLRGLSGTLPATAGTIRLDDRELARLSHRERARRLAVVNQRVEPGDLTVEEYVLLGRTPYREPMHFFESASDRSIARDCLQLTGMWEKKGKLMERLSGGEQQLAAVARALTQQTGIILLDEPTAHLDIAHQMKILRLIRRLNREEGLTVVLVIHDLNLAAEFSERLVLMNRGAIHAVGTPEEVLTNHHIETVYGARVQIQANPLSGKPFVIPLSELPEGDTGTN